MKQISVQERKKDARQKIELGGLIIKAGLRDLDRATILGMLLDAADRAHKDDRQRARFTEIGKKAFAIEPKTENPSPASRANRADAARLLRDDGR